MKLFGFNITRAEKRNSSYSTFSEALQFGNYSNNHSAMTLSAVYRAVEIISDSMALLPIEVGFKEDKKDNKMTNHPLYLAFKDGLLTKYNLMKVMDMLISKGQKMELHQISYILILNRCKSSTIRKKELFGIKALFQVLERLSLTI